jgi:hypothetical protein
MVNRAPRIARRAALPLAPWSSEGIEKQLFDPATLAIYVGSVGSATETAEMLERGIESDASHRN